MADPQFDPSKPSTPDVPQFDPSKPWEEYAAQTDPDLGSQLGRRVQRAARGTSESLRAQLYGHEPQYDYSGADVRQQMDVAAAANPKEVRLALEKWVDNDPGRVGQDKRGRWWVEVDGKKKIVEPEILSRVLTTTPSAALAGVGTVVGGAAGTAAIPIPGVGTAAGAIVGGGAGGAAGTAVEDLIKFFRGNYATPASDEIKRLGLSGLENAAFSAAAPVTKAFKEASRSAYRLAIGAARHKDAVARAVRIWEDSEGAVIPSVESYAPEATRMVRAEQNRNLISYGGLSPETATRIQYMTDRFRRILRSQGMPESEIDEAMATIIGGKSATPGSIAGEGLVSRAQQIVKNAKDVIDRDIDGARSVIRNEEAALRRWSDKTGRVGADVEQALMADRQNFYNHFHGAYDEVHKMSGGARVVDMTAASESAERLMQTVEPGSVPTVVKNVAGLRDKAAALRRQANELRAAGETAGADALDQEADKLLFRTVEEAHGLRTLLREGMRAQTASGGPPGTAYAFLRTVEDSVDDAISTVAKSGNGLPAEAAEALKKVDEAYREGIKFYKNRTVQQITRDAKDGLFAAPEVIAANILNTREVEAAREIWKRLPPPVQEQVLMADMRGKLAKATELDPITGQWVVRGKDFLKEWERTMPVNEIAYPAARRQEIENWARQLAVLDGKLDASALANPDAITTNLRAAAVRKQELDEFVKSNPVAALASQDLTVVDEAVRHITKPKAEQTTLQALDTVGRGTPEWQRVTHWAMLNLFEGAVEKTPQGQINIIGERVLNRLNSYTKKQQEAIFPGGLADDLRTLGEDVFALFPKGGDLAMGLSAGTVTNTSILNIRQVWKQMRFWTMGKIADSQAYLALVADLKRNHPNWEAIKTTLGQMGRSVFNAEVDKTVPNE